jgi:hypothetical protein
MLRQSLSLLHKDLISNSTLIADQFIYLFVAVFGDGWRVELLWRCQDDLLGQPCWFELRYGLSYQRSLRGWLQLGRYRGGSHQYVFLLLPTKAV